MIINDLDDYYIVFDTKNRNIELDTLSGYVKIGNYRHSLKSTIEYLGEWEMLYNPNFNCTEFGTIKNMAGSNSSEWKNYQTQSDCYSANAGVGKK